jgi:hypothetical protein
MKDTDIDIFAIQVGTGAVAIATTYMPVISAAFMIVSTCSGIIGIYRTFFKKNDK